MARPCKQSAARRLLVLGCSVTLMAQLHNESPMAGVPNAFLVCKQAPRLGLGLAALGRPGYINLGRDADLTGSDARTTDFMRQRAYEVMDAAWSAGLRYYDCARSYGKSEEFLSGWLSDRGHKREDIVVGSKWGYRYTADWQVDTGGTPHEVKDHSLAHLEKQLPETMGLLKTHLQLYQIHSATLESGVLEDAAVLSALKALKEQGIRIGLSLSGVKQAVTLRKALDTGVFDCVQATYNLLEQSVGEALLEARQAGLEIIVKEAMANGRVLRRPELLDAAKKLGVAPDALALAAVMAQPFTPMVLSGAVTAEQLQSNAGAVDLADRLTTDEQELLHKLMQDMAVEPDAYWKERSELAWS
eukprot:TRINITY_DN80153_c0_g1_i1.p1 TRINITY_DN80153_c0_g1~~TRINITY_DN80153_c0_g1_i1.p1  ORF type:complete len:359 (-),score=68.56 TRINITY_DN80153_c0_g1_i1:37-1113(-)